MCPKVSFAVKKNLIEPIEEDYPAYPVLPKIVCRNGWLHARTAELTDRICAMRYNDALALSVYRKIPWSQSTGDHFVSINARHGSLQRMEDDFGGACWTANNWAG